MHLYIMFQCNLADFKLDLEFIQPFCHIIVSYKYLTCVGMNQKKTEDKDMR